MFKLVRRLLLAFIALVVILLLARNVFFGWIAKGVIQRLTGFQTHLTELHVRLTRPEISARDITVRNPPEPYHDHRAMEINRIEAVYEPGALLRRKLHFRKLVLDIPQVVAVKNASGEINLTRLQSKAASPSKPSSNFQVDELVISIGEVLALDEKRGNARSRTYPVKVKNRIYRNIKSSKDIKRIVVQILQEHVPNEVLGFSSDLMEKRIESVGASEGIGSPTNLLERGKGILNIFGGD